LHPIRRGTTTIRRCDGLGKHQGDDFKKVLENRKPSVAPDLLASYKTWYDYYKAL